MQFIDSHAHLNDPAFDQDRDTLITQALPQAGVIQSIEIGCAPEEWKQALALAEKFPQQIYAVLGVHPEYAPLLTEAGLQELSTLVSHKKKFGGG